MSNTNTKQHPSLNEWPEWATHWAVDADKRGYFYVQTPEIGVATWNSPDGEYFWDRRTWDAPDWRETLVSRADLEVQP